VLKHIYRIYSWATDQPVRSRHL